MVNGDITLVGKSTLMGNYYICANCGMWVSNGSGHCCTDRTTDRTVEIIELLKQIISRLDGARYERK